MKTALLLYSYALTSLKFLNIEVNVKREHIKKIYITKNNELMLSLSGDGNEDYQYIYREGVGIYWEPSQVGFRSTPLKYDRSISEWFANISAKVKSVFNVELILDDNTMWGNVSEIDKQKILNLE